MYIGISCITTRGNIIRFKIFGGFFAALLILEDASTAVGGTKKSKFCSDHEFQCGQDRFSKKPVTLRKKRLYAKRKNKAEKNGNQKCSA